MKTITTGNLKCFFSLQARLTKIYVDNTSNAGVIPNFLAALQKSASKVWILLSPHIHRCMASAKSAPKLYHSIAFLTSREFSITRFVVINALLKKSEISRRDFL